ncbi:hypothetical protein N781_15905 [Pontibacillus halophilus JSM 076056 = DSM 19796]|uniref:Uncharacterized protein n=1 Tax=Pontibacillus halophilus JSM 076056 = DSM 19796 TaxID=1385510 RepID=A0A0A5G0Z8_9BACI|nr:hypothetical protein [Pontibacillus halophilus]KGX86781.1 hypothetical protein N781_15905 [Pontibacillus halophilus JSM 076056 = DSM 19796]
MTSIKASLDFIDKNESTYNKKLLWLVYLRNMHLIFFIFLTFIVINRPSWQVNKEQVGEDYFLAFVMVSEFLIVLFSFFTVFTPKNRPRAKHEFNLRNKKEAVGLALPIMVFILLSFSYMTMMPLPSGILFSVFLFNGIVVFLSIIMQPAIIYLYEANVFEKDQTTILDYAFKYFAIFTSSINYYVQRELAELPLILNKVLAVLFFIIWTFQTFFYAGIFG